MSGIPPLLRETMKTSSRQALPDCLIVGDLHGDVDTYREIRSKSEVPIILLGDLVDSRVKSRQDQKHLLEAVVKDISDGQPVQCLKGNHELSYLSERMRCSGYSPEFHREINHLLPKVESLFLDYLIFGNTLITHSGLSSNLQPKFNPSELAESVAQKYFGWAYGIGQSRYGSQPYGGIFWCDFNDEFQPIDGLTQIFAHTPCSSIQQVGNNYNLDCLEHEERKQLLRVTNGELVPVFLDEMPVS